MAGWKRKRRGLGSGGRLAGRQPDDDDGVTELDAGAEIDVGSGRRRRKQNGGGRPRGRQDGAVGAVLAAAKLGEAAE